eukprot:TRINITY_DN15820_c1_g3_i1.p1 TRINITY_DN15820_c1_g3~~TRINITY_DN15820_c1_g3_i1.p1  ORF type:complete len:678 (+),score=44.29 TRINITY_DN15820_c1_g3_i1:195-2228(+)
MLGSMDDAASSRKASVASKSSGTKVSSDIDSPRTSWRSYQILPLRESLRSSLQSESCAIEAKASAELVSVRSWISGDEGQGQGGTTAGARGEEASASGPSRSIEVRSSLFVLGSAVAWMLLVLWVVALVVPPLLLDNACHDYEAYTGLVDHASPGFLAIGLAAATGKIYRLKSHASVWTCRYAIAFIIHAACLLIWRWILVICPGDSSVVLVVYVSIRQAGTHISYAVCQFCLAYVSLVRLQWMAEAYQASQAERLLKLTLVVALPSILMFALSQVFHSQHMYVLTYVMAGVVVAFFCAFQVLVLAALLQAGRSALRESRRTGQSSKQAWAAQLTAIAVALSSLTTVGLVAHTVMSREKSAVMWSLRWWFAEGLAFLDLSTDVFLAIACSGLITAAADQERNFKIAGGLVEAARRRKVLHALKDAARAVTGPSLSLAALFEGKDPEDLLEAAVKRFRCISWETLRRHPHLINDGGSLDGRRSAEDLYTLTEPCNLSGCDAFLSHSWHDEPREKWRNLAEWCTSFSEAHGRAPRLWLDKVCIDQKSLQTDLQCLPIFLAGCNSLLVLCGRTYTTRLWCCVELFVFMKMAHISDHEIHVCRAAEDEANRREIADSWNTFDIRQCECFQEEDKRRILHCIEKDSGAEGFNEYIRCLASDLFRESSSSENKQDEDDALASI